MVKLIDILNLMDKTQEISIHIDGELGVFSSSVNTLLRISPNDFLNSEVIHIGSICGLSETALVDIKMNEHKTKENITIVFNLSDFIGAVFNVASEQTIYCLAESLIGYSVYLENHTVTGKITDVKVERDLIFAEVPNKEYRTRTLDAKGFSKCRFDICNF